MADILIDDEGKEGNLLEKHPMIKFVEMDVLIPREWLISYYVGICRVPLPRPLTL
jgi:hypothetical protein